MMGRIATRDKHAGIGLVGLLRWINYVLGVTRHEPNTAGVPASNFLFAGIKLYDFANKQRGNPDELKQLQQDRFQQILKQHIQ